MANLYLNQVVSTGCLKSDQNPMSPRTPTNHCFPKNDLNIPGWTLKRANAYLVPAHNFLWNEIEDETFDLCISGQTFEHNPFFWVTFSEIARILSPGGVMCIIAPGAGPVHRYPYDCWRFYPDSWRSLCLLSGMVLVEDYFETDETASLVPGGKWRDCALIARKPVLEGALREEFYDQLGKIAAPFSNLNFSGIRPPNTAVPVLPTMNQVCWPNTGQVR